MSHVLLKWDAMVENLSPMTFELSRHDKQEIIYAGKDTTYKDETVASGGTYIYTLIAMTAAGVRSNPYTLKVTVKEQLVDFGKVLTVIHQVSGTSVNVTWTDLGEDVVYNVQVRQGSNVIKSVDQTGTKMVVTNIEPQQVYVVEVLAKKTGYNTMRGSVSFEIDYATFEKDLSISAKTDNSNLSCNLSWTDLGVDTEYVLEIRKGSKVILTYNEYSTSKKLTGLLTGEQYTASIVARKKGYRDAIATISFELFNLEFGPFSVQAEQPGTSVLANISWTNLGSNVVYLLRIKKGTTIYRSFSLSATTKIVTDLEYGVDYIVEVEASKIGYDKTTASTSIRIKDKTPPTATHTITNSGSQRIIMITAKDVGSGVYSITNPDGSTTYSATVNYTAAVNGKYAFIIEDKEGNKYTHYVTISDVPVNTGPTLTLAPSTTEPTNAHVQVTVYAQDIDGVKKVKWAKYIQTTAYFQNSGTEMVSGASFVADTNGTYTVYAIDNTGKETIETIFIGNIDTAPPTYLYTVEYKTIKINAQDTLSGVKHIVCPDGTTSTDNPLSYSVNEEGNYAFKIFDKAGNSTVANITVSKDFVPYKIRKRSFDVTGISVGVLSNKGNFYLSGGTSNMYGYSLATYPISFRRHAYVKNMDQMAMSGTTAIFIDAEGRAQGVGEFGFDKLGKYIDLPGKVLKAEVTAHTAVLLLDNGHIYTSGKNKYGQTGQYSLHEYLKTPIAIGTTNSPTRVPNLENVEDFCLTDRALYFIIRENGKRVAYVCGSSYAGELGVSSFKHELSNSSKIFVPTKIDLLPDEVKDLNVKYISPRLDQTSGEGNYPGGANIVFDNNGLGDIAISHQSSRDISNRHKEDYVATTKDTVLTIIKDVDFLSGKYVRFKSEKDTLYEIKSRQGKGSYKVAFGFSEPYTGHWGGEIVSILDDTIFERKNGSLYGVGYNYKCRFGTGYLTGGNAGSIANEDMYFDTPHLLRGIGMYDIYEDVPIFGPIPYK